MPKGFLVKRTNNPGAVSYRIRRNSDECGSECELQLTRFGSPDSGYSASPVNFPTKDTLNNNFVAIERPASPLTVSTNATNPQSSPFYYSSFDKLSVSSNSPNRENLNPNSASKTDNGTVLNSPNKRRGNLETENKIKSPKKPKAARKINFDEDKSSPVSGCIIMDIVPDEEGKVVVGDIDSTFNFVEVTPEARAELEKIENKIGDYICQLCKELYQDAFQLAQHRCSRIVHVEYRCPECDKVFNCPANLASHRRWHKPRPNGVSNKATVPTRILPANNAIRNLNEALANGKDSNANVTVENERILSMNTEDLRNSPASEGQYHCETCGKKFRRQAYLRKHVLNHTNGQTMSCRFCPRTFPSEALKSKHELQHFNSMNNNNNNNNNSNNFNRQLSCHICDTSFPDKESMEQHVRSHGDIFTCKYCSSSFCSSPGLTRHINKCHPSENRQVILLQLPTNINRPM